MSALRWIRRVVFPIAAILLASYTLGSVAAGIADGTLHPRWENTQ